jgi:hypothetical protein
MIEVEFHIEKSSRNLCPSNCPVGSVDERMKVRECQRTGKTHTELMGASKPQKPRWSARSKTRELSSRLATTQSGNQKSPSADAFRSCE